MNDGRPSGKYFSVQDFLSALTEQLDNAQDVMAVKVRAGRPLTWALKELSLDLQVFVELNDRGTVKMRSASPNEEGSSTIKLGLTTITRPMVEENTFSLEAETDPRPIEDIRRAANLEEGDRRRLERVGVRTVGQLQRLSRDTDPRQLEAVVGIPAMRLRAALEAAARPMVTRNTPVRPRKGRPLLRVQGANLSDGINPEVRMAGEPVEVLESSPNELLIRPLAHHKEGQLEVLVGADRATSYFRMVDEDEGEHEDEEPSQTSVATSAAPVGPTEVYAAAADPYAGGGR